jgi:membrane associated rhomboid family serine protease
MENKISRFAIERLMSIVTVAMTIVFVMDMLLMYSTDAQAFITSWLDFDRAAIFRGEVWRIITFLFVYPSGSNILFTVLAIYFFYWSGNAVEGRLGKARFNLYYLFGVLGSIIAGLMLGYMTNTYLNLTIFLAFAVLYPDLKVMIFFIIPVKVKWLGLLEGVLLLFILLISNFYTKIAIIVAILNFLLFFGQDLIRIVKNTYREFKWRNGNYN